MKGHYFWRLPALLIVLSVAALHAEVRTWTDDTGKHKTRAEYVSYAKGEVTLLRSDGKKVTLPLTRLSREDQRYVRERVRKELDEKAKAEEEAKENSDDESADEPDDELTDETEDELEPGNPQREKAVPLEEDELEEDELDEDELDEDELDEDELDEDELDEDELDEDELDEDELDEDELEADRLEAEDKAPQPANKPTGDTGPAQSQPEQTPVAGNNILNSVRGAVYRTQTLNNLRQISLALANYASQKDRFPPSSVSSQRGQSGLSWRVAILPFLDENNLYRQFRLNEPWDSEHNRKLIPQMPKMFLSPGISMEADDGYTNYLAVVGSDTVIASSGRGTRLQDIRDGTSKTVMIVEADDDRAVIWTQPQDLEWDRDNPSAGIGHIWPGHFFAALADGSCRRIFLSVGPETLRGLFTRNGGELVRLED